MSSEDNKKLSRRAILSMIGLGGLSLATSKWLAPVPAAASAAVEDDVYNVMKYGAVGNGATNDQPAIQKAIDACTKAGGGTVYLPAGTYLITSRLFIGGNTILKGNAKVVKPDSNEVGMISIDGSNVSIEELWLENQNKNAGYNINLARNAKHIEIRSCKFTGIKSQAVDMNAKGIAHILIQDCIFEAVTYGVLTNYNADDLEDLKIIGNRFIDIYGDAIEINSPITGTKKSAYEAASNIIISNNYISVPAGKGTGDTAGFGIGLAGASRVSVIGNIIKDCRYEAIHVEDNCRNISITGNIIDGVQNDPNNGLNSGIYVIDAEQIAIMGNEIRNCHNYGIHFEYSNDNQGNKATIIGNNVMNCGSGGIRYAGNMMSDALISGNVVTNNSGAGICLAGDSNSIQIKDNMIRDNKSHGILLEQSKMVSVSGNTIYGNKGECVYVDKPSFSVPMTQCHTLLNLGSKPAKSLWSETIPLGVYADGHLHVVVKKGITHYSKLFRLTWNETELKAELVKETGSTGIVISAPRMSGKKLQINAYPEVVNTDPLIVDIQFQGMIMLN
ncbi:MULTISPECIES: right-handed parallel beta-helix repeat-containing protein [Paenibacillus]|uniref:right-handed parallel beta-helix repeat-containing protein n=1 Tax=Paenibacillus TaxID=44249 RepID=UPI0022B8D98E|nr:right-handed parallel beta-helix repeat-containing protein [Paenibacillus caseinilyticus]MCZ8519305.1 right-handed parallel beta-helix repeat-containing protein [Paenibacillus caseinilyticus]